jgi:Di-sulfide bridge nucleocytoplasmic transport domain
MSGLFTFIESFPNAPSLLTKYLQLFFNSAIILGCLYAIYSFWTTIQADVNRASEDAAAETLAEMAACAKSYVENRCAGDGRLPALEIVCGNWELCMNRDPNSVKRAKLSAHTFAEILNSFVEPISLKTMVSELPSTSYVPPPPSGCYMFFGSALSSAIDHRT